MDGIDLVVRYDRLLASSATCRTVENSMNKRRTTWEWPVIIVVGAFFIVPMLAMTRFAMQRVPMSLLGRDTLFSRWTIRGLMNTISDDQFQPAFLLSVRLGIVTVLVVLALLLPTVLWLHLRAVQWKMAAEIVSLLAYVVPPIALVVGVSGAYRDTVPWIVSTNYGLVPLYAILCLPFAYRTLDAGFAALDLHTLVNASRSLGASWQQTFRKVLIPNLWTAILTTSFLAFAVVMGEFAISSLLLKRTLPTYMVEAQGREPQGAMGVALLLLVLTTVLFMVLGRIQKKSPTSSSQEIRITP
jgi:putative spermidine/putrescine transport system permease protein